MPTRSRTGCATCRKRRMRCDEEKPVCLNCQKSLLRCAYTASIPLRERRARGETVLPGMQQTWAASESMNPAALGQILLVPSIFGPMSGRGTIDPFQSLALDLSHYQMRLLRYCSSTFIEDSASSGCHHWKMLRIDSFSRICGDSAALRSSILIAALHYKWNVGHLSDFEPTLFHQTYEAIGVINEALRIRTPESFVNCVRLIATMAATEACLGDIDTAEVHLNGLMAVMDHSEAVMQLVCGLKSRGLNSPGRSSDTARGESNPSEQAMSKLWVSTLLEALRLLPYFLIPSRLAGILPENFDAPDGTEDARVITEFMDGKHKTMHDIAEHSLTRCDLWGDGAIVTSASDEAKFTNIDSLIIPGRITTSPKVNPTTYLEISWWGLHFSGILYWTSAINLTLFRKKVEERLLRRSIFHVEEELRRTRSCIEQPSSKQASLWFWKAFLGAYSISYAYHLGQHLGKWSQTSNRHLRSCVRMWARNSAMEDWIDAKGVLRQVCWPIASPEEHVAESMWNTIVQ
ncbi:hypothetical protein S7711_08914 [Stachybotrys chartarum IBT 7711]|uniref:Zn(2)-C6 fungal-type domain-containing protein n=1 Tax=Stachybotrys chartarum (strain CBS 109288 / IBT 7711) TaxID=1280523 RepID=A0A084B1V5_STACB|nr:hypothetical protein S7711_08914 [Stachybotrys chartarum IBT 7711]